MAEQLLRGVGGRYGTLLTIPVPAGIHFGEDFLKSALGQSLTPVIVELNG